MGVGEARIREKGFHRGNKIRFRKVVVFARFEAIVISVDRNVFLRFLFSADRKFTPLGGIYP